MKVADGSAVEIDYKLHLGDGKVVDESTPEEPLTYIHGQGHIVPGLEAALEGMSPGEEKKVVVPPDEAYGDSDPEQVQEVERSVFPADMKLEAGMQLMAHGPEGESLPVSIREVKEDKVVVDLNHPLAGQTLHFDVKVRTVRAATEEEMSHGHIHGPDGHGHDHE
jgi:FKBP-type peptidyl-prolyl cis-trans isomerase SlyD